MKTPLNNEHSMFAALMFMKAANIECSLSRGIFMKAANIECSLSRGIFMKAANIECSLFRGIFIKAANIACWNSIQELTNIAKRVLRVENKGSTYINVYPTNKAPNT
jgi:hypothetical protein